MVNPQSSLHVPLLTSRSQGCGMWYQRIQVEADTPLATEMIESTGFKPAKVPSKKRRRQYTLESEDEPAQFCRVTLRCRGLGKYASLSGQRYECHYCDSKFTNRTYLRSHVSLTHDIWPHINCSKCDYRTQHVDDWKRHIYHQNKKSESKQKIHLNIGSRYSDAPRGTKVFIRGHCSTRPKMNPSDHIYYVLCGYHFDAYSTFYDRNGRLNWSINNWFNY